MCVVSVRVCVRVHACVWCVCVLCACVHGVCVCVCVCMVKSPSSILHGDNLTSNIGHMTPIKSAHRAQTPRNRCESVDGLRTT